MMTTLAPVTISDADSRACPVALPGKWLNTSLAMVLCLMVGVLPITLGLPTAEAAPTWVPEMDAGDIPQWDQWHNALHPDGSAEPITLATDGDTDYRIVIPESATACERRAADELAQWLVEMTGAQFEVVPDTETPRERELSVGDTNRVEAAGLGDAHTGGPDGYTIAVEDQRVFLIGGEQAGPLPAVFALLEEDLGVRWYAPELMHGSWSELTDALTAERWSAGAVRVPDRPTLQASIVPRTSRPAIPLRRLNWRRAYDPWGVRNRVNGGYAKMCRQHGYIVGDMSVHTFHRLVPPDEYFEDHPEYFSLIDGERRWKRAQLCLSNPDVAKAASETIAEVLRGIPKSHRSTRYLVGVSQMDWLGDCQCENCRAVVEELGSYGGLQLRFVNRVADILREDFPWATLTTLAYRQSKQPPTGEIEARDNVAVRFCTDFGASFNWPYHSFYDERIAEQREMFERWHEISDRMHLWVYPHQYRHNLAPMPNIRAVAENIRFFAERGAEEVYVQQSIGRDLGREPMRFWLYTKLLWDPARDVEELMLDFIHGYYGEAAEAVIDYHELLWEQCANYTDFSRKRNWIYPIHDEEMYRHGFVDRARRILARAAAAAGTEAIRDRVHRLKVGVVYVEAVQLFMQMRDGDTPPDAERYETARRELEAICDRLGIGSVGFYDGSRSIQGTDEFLEEMAKVRQRRLGRRHLPSEAWGEWSLRKDPEDRGVDERWFAADLKTGESWTPVEVPAFLGDTPVGDVEGYGWYRTTFTLTQEQAARPVELHFGAVDEQAWVYVNGEPAGEHTLESEFIQGEEVTVGDLWNRPFSIEVPAEQLRPGENVLAVRIHNEIGAAGIHRPVRVFLAQGAD